MSALCLVGTLLAAMAVPALAGPAPTGEPPAVEAAAGTAALAGANPAGPSATGEKPAPSDTEDPPPTGQTSTPPAAPSTTPPAEPSTDPSGPNTAAAEPSTAASADPSSVPAEPSSAPAEPSADPRPAPRAAAAPVTVTVSPSSGNFGPVVFTALINGTGTNPTGTVDFTTTGPTGCTTVTVTASGADDAQATCEITVAAGQQVTVTATFHSGDANHTDGTGSVVYQANRYPAHVNLGPSGTGPSGSVTFTAMVASLSAPPTGDVDFSIGGTSKCANVALTAVSGASSTATCAIPVNPGQSVTVTADYSGDGTNQTATNNTTYQADRATPTVTVAGPASPGPSGSITFTATVTGTGTTTPTGTVDFTTDGPTGCTGAALSGSGSTATATCAITVNAAQTVTVTATYSGDSTYDPGTPGSAVYRAKRVVSVNVTGPTSPGPSGSITFTATVLGISPLPTGTVDFSTGNPPTAVTASVATTPACTGVPLSTANPTTATCAITVNPGQSLTVTATYNGDGTYQPATGSTPYSAVKATPTVAVTPSGTGPYGSVTFTATVTGTMVVPTGTVGFSTAGPGATDGTCGAVALTAGTGNTATATCAMTLAPAASVTVTATYHGDTAYLTATGDSTYQAAKAAPTVTVTAPSADPDGNNQGGPGNISFTATVIGVAGIAPGGEVTFAATGAGTLACTNPVTLTPGTGRSTATCQVNSVPLNAEVTVIATYAGDSTYEAGSGQMVYQTATVPVTVAISAPPGSGDVPFTATVTSADGSTPTGTVTISLTTTTLLLAAAPGTTAAAPGSTCTATLVPAGPGKATGTCTLTVPPGATVTVAATYNGSAALLVNSTQTSFKGLRTPTVSLTVSPVSPVRAGKTVTFAARVAADASGIVPTGTVRFAVAGTVVVGCEAVPLTAGQATCTTTARTPGTYRITVSYNGDTEYLAGSAEFAGYTVSAGSTSSSSFNATVTGADVRGGLLAALLLLLAGGGLVAFSSPVRTGRHAAPPGCGPARRAFPGWR